MNLDVSALDRRVRLAPRADLLAALAAQSPLGGGVLTDPLTRQHYEFTAEERTLFERLRSSATLRDLQRMLERAFAPRQFSPTMIAGYLSRLHASGLLVAEGAEQAAALAERRAEQSATRRRWAWTQLLGWRLPGINPDRVLSHFTGLARLVFSPLGAVLFTLIGIAGLAVLLANFSQLVAEAPSVAELRSPQLWLRLALALGFVKSLHELGHALSCKRYGGAVPEMGVMLLALTPCLYTDVSDAWRLPRSQRLIVSGAGILVELALAALSLVVWRLTEPSWLHLAALDVAFVCSFGTLLVNGNPLLRYDGYYLLSDLTTTPNLWSRSRIAVRQRLARWIEKPTREAVEREPTWLALYGVASQAYLTVVMVSLLWLLYQGLRGWRLESIAVLIGGLLFASAVAPPVARGVKQLRNPLYRRRLAPGRAGLALVVTLAALVGVACLPWNERVSAEAFTVASEARSVVATLPGRIIEALPAGATVKAGDVIMRLENPELAREQAQLAARVAEQQLAVEHLRKLRAFDPQAAERLPQEQTALASLESQLRELQAEAERLVLRAPRAGVLIAPAPRLKTDEQEKLATWTGTPLDAANRGAWLEPGDEIGSIGDPSQVAVELKIRAEESDRVRLGQPVRIALAQRPGEVLTGQVVELSRRAVATEAEPNSATNGPWFARGAEPQTGAVYLARAKITSAPPLTLHGIGEAKLLTGESTVGAELWRLVTRTFRVW